METFDLQSRDCGSYRGDRCFILSEVIEMLFNYIHIHKNRKLAELVVLARCPLVVKSIEPSVERA